MANNDPVLHALIDLCEHVGTSPLRVGKLADAYERALGVIRERTGMQPVDTVAISRLLLLSMGTDHIVRGGPGPLFGAGWAAACEHWSRKLLAEDRCEPQGGDAK